MNEADPASPITDKIRILLRKKYTDPEGFAQFKKVLKEYGWTTSIPDSVELEKLMDYMVFIRNKTRGHGTPSKIPIEFYVCLDKLSLFLLHGLMELEFGIFVSTRFEEEDWLVNLSSGGCPKLFPMNAQENNLQMYFPIHAAEDMMKEHASHEELMKEITSKTDHLLLEVKCGEQKQWFDLSTYFKAKEGIVFAYNGRKKGKHATYISYTTGDLIRPSLVRYEEESELPQ